MRRFITLLALLGLCLAAFAFTQQCAIEAAQRVVELAIQCGEFATAGAAYLEQCRVILNLVEAAETDVAEHHLTPRGHLRLGLPLSFGLKRLLPLLQVHLIRAQLRGNEGARRPQIALHGGRRQAECD